MTNGTMPHYPGSKSIRDDGFVKVKQNPEKDIVVSRADRPLDSAPVRFGKRELSEMPLVIRRTSQSNRASVWVDTDGKWWRQGGNIRVQRWDGEGHGPTAEGPRCFVLTLFDGANEDDLKFMLKWVDAAREGRRLTGEWQQLSADWADEFTYGFSCSRAYYDPFNHADKSQLVFPCEEPACSSTWHRQIGRHEADQILKEGAVNYRITVCKMLFPDPGEGWYVDVDDVEFYGTPEEVASMVSDLEWAREECRLLNAPSVAGAELRKVP